MTQESTTPTPALRPFRPVRPRTWITIIIVVAVLVGVVWKFRKPRHVAPASVEIPLSAFYERLFPSPHDPPGTIPPDRFEWLTIGHSTVHGKFIAAEEILGVGRVTNFHVDIPPDVMGWAFVKDILHYAGSAKVDAEGDGGSFARVFLPLVPWLLICLVLWRFFSTRGARNRSERQSQEAL